MTVSECGLRFEKARLVMLVCAQGESPKGRPRVANLECQGSLVEDSLTDTGFRAQVTWHLDFPRVTPLRMNGRHELTFAVTKAIDEYSAGYYAEVNSVVLIYPYIRQLVDEMTVRSLGHNIMVRPLDVPDFLRKYRESQRVQREHEQAKRDGEKDSQ